MYKISDITDFERKGFKIEKFKPSKNYEKLKTILSNLKAGNLKNKDWRLEEKYRGTLDLRPDVNSYDNVFIDLLVENDISKKINFLTQRSLELAHIQVRCSDLGESYMPWHKDTYSYNDHTSGLFPAPIKLIYYLPEESLTPETKLQIIEGSNKCQMSNLTKAYELSPGFDIFDRDVVLKNLNCVNFKNNEYDFLLFDTSCLHNVAKANTKSIRIIYTFCTEYQFINSFGSEKNKNRVNHIKTFNDFRLKNEKNN